MRVDVRDVLGGALGRPERLVHGARGARAGGVIGRDVVGVGRDAGSRELRVDPGAARQGVLLGLEDQHARALAHDEAVAVGVPRTRGRRRVVVAPGEGLHRAERGDGDRVDRRLRATGDDDVGIARLKVVVGAVERFDARGAGRGHGAGERARAPKCSDRNPADAFGISMGTVIGMTRRGPLYAQGVPRVEESPHAADAGGEVDAEPFGIDIGGSRVGPGLKCRDERKLRRNVEALRGRAVEDGLGTNRRLRGERHGEAVLLDPDVLERTYA